MHPCNVATIISRSSDSFPNQIQAIAAHWACSQPQADPYTCGYVCLQNTVTVVEDAQVAYYVRDRRHSYQQTLGELARENFGLSWEQSAQCMTLTYRQW